MKIRGIIFRICAAAVCAALLSSCSDAADLKKTQEDNFATWLDRQGVDYRELRDGVYTYTVIPEDGRNRPFAHMGDSLYLRYEIYRFSTSFSFSRNSLIYTNNPDVMPKGEEWPAEVLKMRLGDGRIMSGVAEALVGNAPADAVTVLLTSGNAYGDKQLQQVPANTPVVWRVTLEEVIPQ